MGKKGEKHPIYKHKEEVIGLIDAYFESCEGKPLTNANGEPLFDKYGYPIIIDKKPPTITGLALALGFTSRQSLLNYQGRAEFRDIITRAKSRVEQYTEERLFDKDGSNGAKFSLQFNFKGWRDEKSDEQQVPSVNIICDIPRTATQVQDGEDENPNTLDPQKVNEMIKALEKGEINEDDEHSDEQAETI